MFRSAQHDNKTSGAGVKWRSVRCRQPLRLPEWQARRPPCKKRVATKGLFLVRVPFRAVWGVSNKNRCRAGAELGYSGFFLSVCARLVTAVARRPWSRARMHPLHTRNDVTTYEAAAKTKN